MPIRIFFAILIGFPILEGWVGALVAQKIGWWLALWLLGSAVIGVNLIRQQQFALLGRLMGAVQQGADPFQALFASSRVLLAGLLFIFPGVISDALAVALLMWPRPRTAAPTAPDVIEGEFRRERDPSLPKQ